MADHELTILAGYTLIVTDDCHPRAGSRWFTDPDRAAARCVELHEAGHQVAIADGPPPPDLP